MLAPATSGKLGGVFKMYFKDPRTQQRERKKKEADKQKAEEEYAELKCDPLTSNKNIEFAQHQYSALHSSIPLNACCFIYKNK